MSQEFKIVSKNAIRDIHGFILKVKEEYPNLQYQFGKDESKYQGGFLPDIFIWENYKSTRFLSWESERQEDQLWHYDFKIPVLSNCSLWQIALPLIAEVIKETDGKVYIEGMYPPEDTPLISEEFEKWKSNFSCQKVFESEFETTISLLEFKKQDITIFGMYAPFTFNTNILDELKAKKNPIREFEKRMLKLQNAAIDEGYTRARSATVKSKHSEEQFSAIICNCQPFSLIINDEIDYVVFVATNDKDDAIVPAKKVREVMPAECFFDEYSFYVDLFCEPIWDNEIMKKAKRLDTEV